MEQSFKTQFILCYPFDLKRKRKLFCKLLVHFTFLGPKIGKEFSRRLIKCFIGGNIALQNKDEIFTSLSNSEPQMII